MTREYLSINERRGVTVYTRRIVLERHWDYPMQNLASVPAKTSCGFNSRRRSTRKLLVSPSTVET